MVGVGDGKVIVPAGIVEQAVRISSPINRGFRVDLIGNMGVPSNFNTYGGPCRFSDSDFRDVLAKFHGLCPLCFPDTWPTSDILILMKTGFHRLLIRWLPMETKQKRPGSL